MQYISNLPATRMLHYKKLHPSCGCLHGQKEISLHFSLPSAISIAITSVFSQRCQLENKKVCGASPKSSMVYPFYHNGISTSERKSSPKFGFQIDRSLQKPLRLNLLGDSFPLNLDSIKKPFTNVLIEINYS